MEIVKVTSKRLFKHFLNVPDLVHENEINYVSALKLNVKATLNKKKNPLWKKGDYALFIAMENGNAVGRIAAIYFNEQSNNQKNSSGYFGYFDSINDLRAAKTLLLAAGKYLAEFGCEKMTGPLNPNVNYELGILTKGFEEKPFFMMNYNSSYYEKILLESGGKEAMKFLAFCQPCAINTEKIERVTELISKRNSITIEDVQFSKFKTEAHQLCEIYNDAFARHWESISFSPEEFLFVAKDMKPIMDKKLIFKIRVNAELAGFILALPNLNEALVHLKNGKLGPLGILKFLYYKWKIKWVKVMVVAIKRKYQHLGLGSVLYMEMAKRVKECGYVGGELSWVAEENTAMIKAINSMGAKVTKEYKVFEFNLPKFINQG